MRCTIVAVLIELALGVSPTLAQDVRVSPDARRLVVATWSFFAGPHTKRGAGILIGQDSSGAYVATAAHVVYIAGRRLDSVQIAFLDHPDRFVAATWMAQDTLADVALLKVPAASLRAAMVVLPRFHHRGDARTLVSGDPVEPVGCPHDVCWAVSPLPGAVVGADLKHILFDAQDLTDGSSGGPIFDRWADVVGMTITEDPGRNDAVPIALVLSQAHAWGAPVRLAPPLIPHRGYPVTLELAGLGGNGSPSNRFPAMRATIGTRIGPFVTWHLGFLRLAPTNVSLNAGVAGLGVDLRLGRVTLRPFADAGFGYMATRVDQGGYYVGSTAQYVPVWRRSSGDRGGGGGGAALDVIVLPHFMVEGVVGSWNFEKPAGAPSLPSVVFGGGFRLGAGR